MTSNRSPSPLPTRPNPDPRNPETISAIRPTTPNPRNSEANSAVRRSFSGNPFVKPSPLTNPRSFNPTTPANSPSDHVKRHFSGRESVPGSRFHEEKENESKFEKVRSPVTKGSKNFMSPTISAASKFTPSPRKKILSERNEPGRASMDFDPPKSEPLSDQTKIASEFPQIPEPSKVDGSNDLKFNHKRVRFEEHLVSEVIVHKKDELKLSEAILSNTTDSVVLDLSPKNEPSPIIAPLDADPSFSAYDPKTNYLSPRPRFLRYKPNPRIQLLLIKEKGFSSPETGNTLEDGSVPSENSSESDVMEESQCEDLNRESDDLSSIEPNSEEETDPVVTSEPIVVSTTTPAPEQVLEAKMSRKSWPFRKSKSVRLLLAILIASVSLISLNYPPIMISSVVKDVGIFKVNDPSMKFAEFAKANLDRFNQWSLDSVSYLSDLKLYLSGADNLGPIKFMNLTSTPQEEFLLDPWIKENLDYKKLGKITEQDEEDIMEDVDAVIGTVIGEEELEREDDVDLIEVDESSGKEPDKDREGEAAIKLEFNVDDSTRKESDREGDEGMQLESSVVGSTRKETDRESEVQFEAESVIEDLEIDDDIHVRTNSEDGLVLISNIHESKPEEIELADVGTELSDLSKPELLDIRSETMESEVVTDNGPGNMFLWVPNVIGVYSALLCMVLATIFIYLRKGKTSIANVADPLLPPNKQVQKQGVSHNCGTEVDHLKGESYTVSNSQNTITSYSKGTGGRDNTSEAQSHEMRPRRNYNKRESMAFSSSDFSMSPSYGSFTTYGKIPIKHASGEEEILTPIRRSSRLVSKKHVTSS